MLTRAQKTRRDAERDALRGWLAGPGERPFVLPLHEDYPVDGVVLPSFVSRLAVSVRYVLLALARVVPPCGAKRFLWRLAGVKVGRDVCITPGVVIDPMFPMLIELGDGCCLGMGCRLFPHEYTASGFRLGRIRVGAGAVIGICATVRGGVAVGPRATVGASSFVNRDVAEGETVGGVPARPLRRAAFDRLMPP